VQHPAGEQCERQGHAADGHEGPVERLELSGAAGVGEQPRQVARRHQGARQTALPAAQGCCVYDGDQQEDRRSRQRKGGRGQSREDERQHNGHDRAGAQGTQADRGQLRPGRLGFGRLGSQGRTRNRVCG
jgi:hypothetical protein